jgi:hypothetical protein
MTGRKTELTKDKSMATSALAATQFAPAPRPPSGIWTLVEGRAVFELGAFYMTRPLLSHLPKGDGHAVQVLPGFMASNSSTVPMRRLLKGLGYDAHGWDSGRNVRVDNALIARLEAQLKRLNDASGRKVSLVGWSLGGVLARELAKLHPDRVRLVIATVRAAERQGARADARRALSRSWRGAAGSDHVNPDQDRRDRALARIGAEADIDAEREHRGLCQPLRAGGQSQRDDCDC